MVPNADPVLDIFFDIKTEDSKQFMKKLITLNQDHQGTSMLNCLRHPYL